MKRFFVFVLGLLSIISCSQLIVELEGDIQGVVKDYSHGGMINNCLVTITPGGKSVTTTPAGIYEFKDLEGGDYTLTFSLFVVSQQYDRYRARRKPAGAYRYRRQKPDGIRQTFSDSYFLIFRKRFRQRYTCRKV